MLIFNSKTDEVVGFSTVAVQHFYLNGKDYTVLFSGDTVILKSFGEIEHFSQYHVQTYY
jgi:hypothetical protein